VFIALPLAFAESRPGYYYLDEMRLLVQEMSVYARKANPDFIVIAGNGAPLLTRDASISGPLMPDYIKAIDAVSQEGLFYGDQAVDMVTEKLKRNRWLTFLELARQQRLPVFVIDYCRKAGNINRSYRQNKARTYLSFTTPTKLMDTTPLPQNSPIGTHPGSVAELNKVQNFIFAGGGGQYPNVSGFLSAVGISDSDLLITSLDYRQSSRLTEEQVEGLKRKSSGGRRLVLAAIDLSRLRPQEGVWQPAWSESAPAWLKSALPTEGAGYVVAFWQSGWKHVLFGNYLSWLNQVLSAGFDGVYLNTDADRDFHQIFSQS